MADIPKGFQKISGAKFPTREKQQAAFTDIRPVGEVGQAGSFLAGKPTEATRTAQIGALKESLEKKFGNQGIDKKLTTTQTEGGLLQVGERDESGKRFEKFIPVKTVPEKVEPAPTITTPAPKTLTQQLAEIQGKIGGRQTAGELREVETTRAQLAEAGAGRGRVAGLVSGRQAKIGQERLLERQTEAIETAGLQRQEQALLTQIGQEQAITAPKTVGNQIVQFNPETNQFDVVFDAPKEEKAVALSPGQTLVDPTSGEVIFKNPITNKPVVVGKDSALVNPDTGETLFQGGGGQIALNESDVDTFAKNVLDGVASLGNVPQDLRIAVSNRINKLLRDGFNTLTPVQKEDLNGLSDDLRQEPLYRNMLDVQNGFQSVEVGIGQSNGIGDLAAINGFQRMIDPGVAVREGEFQTVEDAQGFLQKSLNLTGKLVEGARMTDKSRAKMLEAAESLYDAKASRFNDTIGAVFDRRAEALDVPIDMIGAKFPLTSAVDLPTEEITDEEFNTLREEFPDLTDEEIQSLSFSGVGGDTQTATGNRPQRNNNPGNVKRGGIADKFALKNPDGTPKVDDQGHLIFPNSDAGFQGLASDLGAKISGRSRVVKEKNPTIRQVGKAFAEDPNWPISVAKLLGVSPDTKTQSIDFNNLLTAVATQEGFFA